MSDAFAKVIQLKETENSGKSQKAEGASAENGSTMAKVEEGDANVKAGHVEESG